jgi:hypothetical protein
MMVYYCCPLPLWHHRQWITYFKRVFLKLSCVVAKEWALWVFFFWCMFRFLAHVHSTNLTCWWIILSFYPAISRVSSYCHLVSFKGCTPCICTTSLNDILSYIGFFLHTPVIFIYWHGLTWQYIFQCLTYTLWYVWKSVWRLPRTLGLAFPSLFYIEYATCFSDFLLSRSQLHSEGWSTLNKPSVAGGGDEPGQRKLQMMDMALSPAITKDLKLWRLDPHDMSQYLSEWGTRRATWANIWCSA